MKRMHKGAIVFFAIIKIVTFQWSLIEVGELPVENHWQAVKEPEVLALDFPTIHLKSLTIKEGETYQITDFIEDTDSSYASDLSYTYKENAMGTYQMPGTYKITIAFQDSIGRINEVDTELVIEKKPVVSEPKKVTTVKTTTKTTPKTTKKASKPIPDQVMSDTKALGTSGRLYFSNLYSVALYKTNVYDSKIQTIVDNKDSAAIFEVGKNIVIGDHSIQGFDIIKKQKVGDKAYIKVKEDNGNIQLKTYVVKEKVTGTNTGSSLITKDGRDIATVDTDLVMYTCNSSDGKSVTIVLWDEIEK